MANIMTVRVPEELQDTLKQIAAKRGFTRNSLVLQILRTWLEDWEKEEEKEKEKRGEKDGTGTDNNPPPG